MAKKELWQINWFGGQTEGDLTKATVKEILNAEINILGTLYPRDELVYQTGEDDSIANVIDMKFITNPDDPSETLRVYLTTTHLRMRGDTTTIDIALGVTLDSDSEMAVVEGNSIYIAAIVSGVPIGLMSVDYVKSGDRFKYPVYLGGHTDADEQTGSVDAWVLNSVTGVVPDLTRVSMTATYITTARAQVETAPLNSVVIGTFLNYAYRVGSVLPDDYPITLSIGVDIGVQFEFHNGELSPISNLETFSYNIDPAEKQRTISIGLNLVVSTGISDTVKAVHVYRRLRELDGTSYQTINPLELMFTAQIMSEEIDYMEIPGLESSVLILDDGYDTTAYGWTGLGETPSGVILNSIQNRSLLSGTVSETVGWLNYSNTAMFYFPRCLMFDGSLRLKVAKSGDVDNYYYIAEYDSSVGVFRDTANAGSDIAIFTDTDPFDGFSYSPFLAVLAGGVTVTPRQQIGSSDAIVKVDGYGPDLAPYMINNGVSPVLWARHNGSAVTNQAFTGVSDRQAIVCHVDYGEAGLVTLDDLVGFAQEEASIVKPRHIGVSSGRMLMLNVIQDDDNKPARLCYSEFRKYRSVAKANYIDYDARDDGVGIGLSEFKGRVIVLHSTSAYIMDITGGGGMSWRELGAYNEINALGRPAIIESPFGTFFGGTDYAYLFDGNGIRNITDAPDKRVTKQYREMVARGTPSFAWRSDLRQLWIVSLGDDGETEQRFEALVYDADLKAWHHHYFDEIVHTSAITRNFLAISNQGGSEYLYMNWELAIIEKWAFDDTTVVRPFTWGIYTGQINMGSSEFQKKLKRIYIDTEGKIDADDNPTYGQLYIDVDGFEQGYSPGTERHVERMSFSNKNYYLDFSLLSKSDGGESWTGAIESLGMSYKPKKLK